MPNRTANDLFPWTGNESIYSFISRHIDQAGRVAPFGLELPDSEHLYHDKSVRWIAGAMDGVWGHHTDTSEDARIVERLAELVKDLVNNPSYNSQRNLYDAVLASSVLSLVDPLLDYLWRDKGLDQDQLHTAARWLAAEASHREPVKLGIALMGMQYRKEDRELLMTLGKYEEFTLYVAATIARSFPDANNTLYELARHVTGWGKISLVERMLPTTPEIKNWLLREGCRNDIADNYLAYTCAVKGGLHEALNSARVDRELFNGAGIIICGLIEGGPSGSMDDYVHAGPAVSSYLKHGLRLCKSLEDFLTVADIRQYLDGESDALSVSWGIGTVAECGRLCSKILSDTRWPKIIWEEIDSASSFSRYCAMSAARVLGLDIWDKLFSKLEYDPTDSSIYYELMRSSDTSRIASLVSLAQARLPLELISTGPAEELGLGPEHAVHRCLNVILQGLPKFAGMGGTLVLTGLNSPVSRDRNMSLRVLEAWPVDSWPREAVKALERMKPLEPHETTLAVIDELLLKSQNTK